MEVITIIQMVLTIIGGATVLLRMVAPLTKTKKDDIVVEFLLKFLKMVSLNLDDSTVKIKVK